MKSICVLDSSKCPHAAPLLQGGGSSIMFTDSAGLAAAGVFLSSNREGDSTDACDRLHHSRTPTKALDAPRRSLNGLTVAALHLGNLE